MARAQLIIASVVEGRSKSQVARDYGVSRYWVQQLVHRYEREGPAGHLPIAARHSRADRPAFLVQPTLDTFATDNALAERSPVRLNGRWRFRAPPEGRSPVGSSPSSSPQQAR
jgi:transposase-like protein